MAHDPATVLLGTTQSSYKVVDSIAGTIPAGKVVRLKSDGTPSLLASDGSAIGISLGQGLSFIPVTSVCRKGTRVPILLTEAFNPTVGTQVYIHDTTGIASSSSGATGTNATYATARIAGGIDETGATVGVAFIDFPGGL